MVCAHVLLCMFVCASLRARMCVLVSVCVCLCMCVWGEGGVGVGVGLCNGMFVVLAGPGPTSSHKAPLCSLSDI
jgi:hypothetical protein